MKLKHTLVAESRVREPAAASKTGREALTTQGVPVRMVIVTLDSNLASVTENAQHLLLSLAGSIGSGLHVNRDVREVDGGTLDAILTCGEEDVPVALLDGQGQFLLRALVQLVVLVLLVGRELRLSLGRAQRLQGEPAGHAVLHCLAQALVREHEDQVVLVLAEVARLALGAEDPVDQLRNLEPVPADGLSVVVQEHEVRPTPSGVVGHVRGVGCKRH